MEQICKKKGMVFVGVLALMLLVFSLATTYFFARRIELEIAVNHLDELKAFYRAESGLQQAWDYLMSNGLPWAQITSRSCVNLPSYIPGGSVVLKSGKNYPDEFILQSETTEGRVKKRLHQRINVIYPCGYAVRTYRIDLRRGSVLDAAGDVGYGYTYADLSSRISLSQGKREIRWTMDSDWKVVDCMNIYYFLLANYRGSSYNFTCSGTHRWWWWWRWWGSYYTYPGTTGGIKYFTGDINIEGCRNTTSLYGSFNAENIFIKKAQTCTWQLVPYLCPVCGRYHYYWGYVCSSNSAGMDNAVIESDDDKYPALMARQILNITGCSNITIKGTVFADRIELKDSTVVVEGEVIAKTGIYLDNSTLRIRGNTSYALDDRYMPAYFKFNTTPLGLSSIPIETRVVMHKHRWEEVSPYD